MAEPISDIAFEAPLVDVKRGGWGRDFQASVVGSKVTGRVFYEPEGRYHTGQYPLKVIFDRDDESPIAPIVVQDCETSDEVRGFIIDDEAVADLTWTAILQHAAPFILSEQSVKVSL